MKRKQQLQMMRPKPTPIACVLSALSPEEVKHERLLLDLIARATLVSEETSRGYRFDLSSRADVLNQIGELIAIERKCCPLLGFEVRAEAEGGPISLHVWGREGVKDFIRTAFVAPGS